VKKHIYIYSPSSAVRDKAVVRRGVARLKALGHEVELDEAVFATHMRFAGDDETRLAAIHRAAASGADVALITRGGYGLTRILPGIRYKAVAKAIEKGTRFVGLSDFTAFQNAVLAKTGAVTWSGPALGEDFGAALVGTPWMPQIKGGILFLEDVHEHPYRIERMLTQLLHAGILGEQKAILFGHFTNYKPYPHDKGFKLQTVMDWLRTKVKAPVLTRLPFGHVATKVALPVGAPVHLAVEGRDAFVLWGHHH
jgi:muramoyltetrapeptide carboxypeptidase